MCLGISHMFCLGNIGMWVKCLFRTLIVDDFVYVCVGEGVSPSSSTHKIESYSISLQF